MHNSICAFNFRPNPTVSLNPRYFTTIFYKSLFEKIKKKKMKWRLFEGRTRKGKKMQPDRPNWLSYFTGRYSNWWQISVNIFMVFYLINLPFDAYVPFYTIPLHCNTLSIVDTTWVVACRYLFIWKVFQLIYYNIGT